MSELAGDPPASPELPGDTEALRKQAEWFLQAAREITAEATRRSITLRLLGSLAYRRHCPRYTHLLDEMMRVLTDLDFASERRFANDIESMFRQLDYRQDIGIAGATGGARFYYKHPTTGLGVDIFMDKLDYCHAIPFNGRLLIDSETIPLAELLLEKMQIVELNAKDVKDTIVLLLEHDVGDSDEDVVNVGYVARMLASDWGFFYTVTTNLQKVAAHLNDFAQLQPDERALVRQRLGKIAARLESQPKSLRWTIRSRVGTRVQWYQTVEAKAP